MVDMPTCCIFILNIENSIDVNLFYLIYLYALVLFRCLFGLGRRGGREGGKEGTWKEGRKEGRKKEGGSEGGQEGGRSGGREGEQII